MPAPPPKSEALESNLSVCFADSSPNRGALGRPGQPCCSLGLNRAQSAGPCSHWKQLRDCALPKSAGQAAVNLNSGARPFPIPENFARPEQSLPTRQWLPYQGSWREAPERLYQGTLSSKNRFSFAKVIPSAQISKKTRACLCRIVSFVYCLFLPCKL